MYALAKLVIVLISPLGTCLALALLGLALGLLHWRRTARALVAIGLLWLTLWSLPAPSFWLVQSLEGRSAQRPAAAYPRAAAIVVLGGGMQGRWEPWIDRPEASSGAADRVWFAAQLYKAGRAPWIIVSAGGDPRDGQVEAYAMAALLEDLGVPRSALLLDAQSRNTWQNAEISEELLRAHDLHDVLLVTSALHMPRALAVFRKRGIEATPAPADFNAPPQGAWPLRWLPSAEWLWTSSRAFTEYVGLCSYRLRGKA